MRKALLGILVALTLVLMTLVMKNGLSIGSFRIYGFQGISNKSQELTQHIDEANKQNDQYTATLGTIKADVGELTSAKKEYLDLIARSTDNEIKLATQTKNYTIEYLWSRVGNHATSLGVKLKMEVVNSTLQDQDYRNLNFTVNGRFLAVTQFIANLENDTSLDFTIDDFHMSPGDGTIIEASFVVKDVKIMSEKLTNSTSTIQNETENTATNQTTQDGNSVPTSGTVTDDGNATSGENNVGNNVENDVENNTNEANSTN